MNMIGKMNKVLKVKRLLLAAAVVVVFVTTYSLILPAITMERKTYCGMEEHTHSDDCYTVTKELVCGQEESKGHTHSDECYTEEKVLVCTLEENDEHTHGDECYETEKILTCSKQETEGHSHSDVCYETTRELTCGMTEHVHTDECFVDPNAETEAVTKDAKPEETAAQPAENTTEAEPSAEESTAAGETEAEETSAEETQAEESSEEESSTAEETETADAAYPAMLLKAEIPQTETETATVFEANVPEGCLPEGTQLFVSVFQADTEKLAAEINENVEKTLKGAPVRTKTFTIDFVDAEGNTVLPKKDVQVFVKDALIQDADQVELVSLHLDVNKKNELEFKKAEAVELNKKILTYEDEVVYDSEKEDPQVLVLALTTAAQKLGFDGADYQIAVDCPAKAGIPSDAVLEVSEIAIGTEEYDQYLEASRQTLDVEEDADAYGRFFDINILDANGNKLQPAVPVDVKITFDEKDVFEEPQVVHFEEEAPVAVEAEKKDDAVKFEAEGFSVYGIVGTETIETTVLTADGETYKITVNYTEEAEIPNGSELVVREIVRGTSEYEEYRAQTQEALGTSDLPVAEIADNAEPADEEEVTAEGAESDADGVTYQVTGIAQSQLTFMRLFDISIMNGEEEVEPKVPVEVVITYVEPVKTDDGSNLDVVHFTADGVEILDEVTINEEGTEIKYEAESFSVYGTTTTSVGAGDYIIYRDGNQNDYALNYNNGTLGRQSVNISGNQVYSAQDNVVWTFTAVTGGYRLSYQVGNTTYYLRNNNGNLATTTNVNQASTWTYNNRRLTSGNRSLNYSNSSFNLTNNGSDIYLARIAAPASITIHYVNESGEDVLASHELEDSTSSGQIKDLIPAVAGYTYHNTYLTSTSGTRIVPELRGAGGGQWEYQVYGQQNYTQFSGDTDIYVVYGSAYGGGSGSGGGGGGDDLNIDTPSAGKLVTPNTDGTFTLSLSITGEKDTGDDPRGANVILVLDTSNSMNGNVSTGGTRFSNAVSAAQNVSSNLLGLNTEDYPNLVEMCLVEFNYDVATSGWYNEAGTPSAQGTYPEGSFNRKIADASRNSGTNWEEALQAAIAAANGHNDGDNTYIIFLTDGNPSANSANSSTNRYDTEASASNYRTNKNYMTATDEARQIIQNGWNFYTIGMYGNVDVLRYLTNFAYYGESVNQTENKDTEGTYYYPAAQTSTLIAALNDIADVISNSLAVAGVDFNDGIATDVTHTSLSSNIGSGTLGGITYRKSGGDTASYTVTTDASGNATFNFSGNTVAGTVTTISYKKIVDVEGGDPQEQDATAQVYAATYNGKTYYMPIATVSSAGDFEWDVAPLGTLEDNATYTVSFVVWPDQDAYDYVTNLNNGISGYTWDSDNEVPVYQPNGTTIAYYTHGVSQFPNIVKYPNGTFAAMSNTYQKVDYYVAKTEEVDGVTSTTYEKGVPIALDIPDPMVLTSSSFQVRKSWSDSLDTSQLDKLIADAEAEGKVYGVTLNLTEDGEFYKSYTFTPVKNTETGEYEWPAQTISIAPALLTSSYPGGGNYNTVTIDGVEYYVLNNGHQYVLEETNTDSHFEFNTITYHPALVNGVLKNVTFEVDEHGNIVNGSTGTVVGNVPLTEFEGENTLRGGINIYKKVVEEDGTEVEDNTDVFDAEVTLTVPMKDGQPDFSHVENYYDTDNVTVLIPSVAWYRYYDDAGNVIYDDALIDAGILEDSGQPPTQYGRIGQGENYDGGGWFYLDFDNTTGTVTGNVKITPQYTLRFTNMAAGTTYNLTETDTQGMQPTYEFWHDNAESNEKIVIGNAGNNIRVTNKIVNRKVIVYKTDDNATTPKALANAQFTINGETLTSGSNGYTEVIELPTSGTPYDLIETEAPDGYNKLTEAVKVTVSSNGVTYQQGMGQPQIAEKDADGNYVVHVTNNTGYELPHTGGPGTLPYTLGGLALIMASALMYGFRMRRRERRLN